MRFVNPSSKTDRFHAQPWLAVGERVYDQPPMSLFAPSERPETVETRSAGLARTIRGAIMDGRLKPGQPLREGELAQELGTSRTPIREALLLLQSEGLVEASPNRGSVVRRYDETDLAELYALRAVLEGYAARCAADRLTSEQLGELKESNERYRKLRSSDKLPELVAENLEFHDVILQAAGSARLWAMVRQLKALPMIYQSYMAYSEEHRRAAEADHRAITAALEARDSALAAEHMERHVRWAGDRAIEHVRPAS
jgi:DNA-binding GntR family transcriptional regulator